MIHRLACLMLLAWVSAAHAQLPGIGPTDPRRTVDISAQPWNALARVQTELGTRCTGVAVGPAAILTAAHCLVAPRTRRLMRAESIHVLLGYDQGRYAAHQRVLTFRVGPGFHPADATPASADWALLTLAGPITDSQLSLGHAHPGEIVAVAGYEQDRAETLLADRDCRIQAILPDAGESLIRDDCAATRGASGAPLLAWRAGKGWVVVGIQVRAIIGHQGGLAVPVHAIMDSLPGLRGMP